MISKAGQYLLVIFALLLLNFILPRMMPGDPTDFLTGTAVDAPIDLDAESRSRLLEYHGLDKPLTEQFLGYLGKLARFDLGFAIYYRREVSDLLLERLPWTLLLAGTSFLLAAIAGVLLGALAAYRQGSRLDKTLVSSLMGVRAMPAYLVGMLAILLFSIKLKLFPTGGACSPFASHASVLDAGLDILWHLALPALVLTAEQIAGTFLIMRSSMVATLGETYMLMAEAKGLSWGRRVFRYGVRNAILPLYTQLGVHLGFLVTVTIFTESVFNYPGMGRLAYEAAMVHDYPVLQGVFLITSLSIVGLNILVDCTYRLVDPRTGHADE
ncbi:MAG: ABC transporter permease [Deltaproteobacteria bacterium]|nr:ABC transporter permease [Deltaproteobacteria bacterium]